MEELRDADGLTEQEFLATYDVTKYDRPSVTVDIIILKDSRALLIRRGGHPCIGKLAFPGGFVEPDEDVYNAAKRELMEETCLNVSNLRQLCVASEPKRDPRTRIITVPFLAEVKDDSTLLASDDAMSAKWYAYSYKKSSINGVTLFEVSLSGENERTVFKVSKSRDKTGLRADPIYKTVGASPMAGDHAELFVQAIEAMENLNG